MNYLRISLFLLVSSFGFSQAPEAFKYQGVLRNPNGQIIADQNVAIRINILESSVIGTNIYSELHSTQTGANGTFNIEIGKGKILNGLFGSINWGGNTYFVKIEMDHDKDNSFEDIGTTQLLSVPYALFAKKSGGDSWVKLNNDIYYSKGKVGIGTNAPEETLHINGSIRGNQNGAVRINTTYGYIDVGPKNGDFAHFYTNMPHGFYFGADVTVREQLVGYKAFDLHLSTESNTTFTPVKRVSILNSNGYVGIAKTNPQYMLDVNGTINASGILLNGQPLATAGSAPWSVAGSTVYYNGGNVGIGTSTPAETLHINGSIRGNQSGALRINTPSGYIDVGPKNADFAHFYTNMPHGFYFGADVTVREQLVGYKDFDLHLSTESNSTFTPVKRMSILNSNGYVGIGTTDPKSKLQVESGDIYLSNAGTGVIMKSPNNQCWRLTVSDTGTPVFTSITCP